MSVGRLVALIVVGTVCDGAQASREVIGHSSQGRPIVVERIGDPNGPRILVVGCIHGNECAGRAITTALRSSATPADVWILPTINPDGALRGTRHNARGVDLNRNWSVRWRPAGRRWQTYYPGPRAWSEPETRLARSLITRLRPQATIWYHQHMDLVWASGPSLRAGSVYARAASMSLLRRASPAGAATAWQRHLMPRAAAFVVELPAGRLDGRAITRHVRAIAAVAATLA